MKLKNKLLCLLTSSVVAASTLSAAIGCSCGKKPVTPVEPEEEPWDIGISFKGDSQVKTVDDDTSDNITFDGFELSTSLAWGETMSVELTGGSDANVEIVHYPTMPEYQFDIEFKLKEQPNEYTEYKFGLIFKFYVDGVEKTSKLIDNFNIQYVADWAHNDINWKTKDNGQPYSKEFNLAEGQHIYYTDYFYLDHKLETPREQLVLKSVVGTGGPNDVTAVIDQIDGTKVKVLFDVTGLAADPSSSRIFDLYFRFTYNGVEQGDADIQIGGFKITPRESYEAPKIDIGQVGETQWILETTQGSTGVCVDSFYEQSESHERYFKLNKELGANDEIKVIDNKGNVDTTCWVNDKPDATLGAIYIDVMFSFNDIYDPYASDKNETVKLTFQFYHLNELVSEQTLKTDFTLKYTPLIWEGDPEEKGFGIVFEPVVIDTDGDFKIDFVGKIGKRDSTSWEESELHKGEYLTIINNDYGDVAKGDHNNMYQLAHPAVEYNPPELSHVPTIDDQLKPIEAIEGTDEGLTEIDVSLYNLNAYYYPYHPTVFMKVLDNMTQLETKFYNEDPIANPEATPTSIVHNEIDFVYYPAGYWETDSVSSTDTWISDRTFALLTSYQTIPGDESTRVTNFANMWIINPPRDGNGMNAGTSIKDYDAYVATSRDVYEKIKPILAMSDEERLAAGVRVGIANRLLARKYIGAGSTDYITPNDFIYLDPTKSVIHRKGQDEPETLYTFEKSFGPIDKAQEDLLWDRDDYTGADIAVFQINIGNYLEESDITKDPWAAECYERNKELSQISVRSAKILESWLKSTDHEGQMTNLEADNGIDNWDQWACALCAGFTNTTIKVNGVDTPALYWISHDIQFDYGHLPDFCTYEESKQQHFANIGTYADCVVKHASPAYKLPDRYSRGNDPENIWFGEAGSGAMFVIRKWKEYGKTLEIPRVAGINWNGGNTVSGTDLFYPWIDIFYNNGTNLLNEYVLPTNSLPENFFWF